MSDLDRALQRMALRERMQAAIATGAAPLAAGALVACTVISGIKLGIPGLGWLIPATATAGVLVPLLVALRAGLRTRSQSAVAGRLDLALDAQGLVMALSAVPPGSRDAAWMARLPRHLARWQPPALGLRPLVPPLLAVLALVGAIALPQQHDRITSDRSPPLVAGVEHRLHEAIAQGLLDRIEEQRLTERLAAIRQRAAEAGMDQGAWEALDRVVADLDRTSAEAGRRLGAALAAAEGAASGDPAAQTALAVAVADLAEHHPDLLPEIPLGAGGAELAAAMQAALDKAVREGRLTPEQAAALRHAGEAAGQPGGDPAAAARQLAEALAQAGAALDAQCQAALQREQGRSLGWGVDRGPGHAPLTMGDPTRTAGGFADGLAAGQRRNQDGSVTLATSSRDPEAAAQAVNSARAAASEQGPATADGQTARVAPRHRAVMQRYFKE